jgi:RNA polymerase sigma-70 factor (ECF subfamily)
MLRLMNAASQGEARMEKRSILFLRHQRMVRAFIRSLVPSLADAEDLLQEVGVQVLNQGEDAMDPQIFPAWCRGVARNVVLHHWRSRYRSRETPREEYIDLVERIYAQTDGDVESWNERHVALMECVQKLDPADRDLLALRYAEDLTSDAIAERQSRSAAAVRKTLERLREGLRRCIERRLEIAHGGSR